MMMTRKGNEAYVILVFRVNKQFSPLARTPRNGNRVTCSIAFNLMRFSPDPHKKIVSFSTQRKHANH